MKNCIKHFSLIFFLVFSFCQRSFCQWQWSEQIGSGCGPYGEKIWGLITDGQNYYVCGDFYGCLLLQDDTLLSNGTNDMFIAKYDGNGNEIWSQRIGGNYNQFAASENVYAVYDSINNFIYLSGEFIGTVDFGNNIILSAQFSDIFVAKMDTAGNFIWAVKAGGNGHDDATIFLQPDGKILISGNVSQMANFGSIQVNPGCYFARLDTSGNFIWAEQKFKGMENLAYDINFIGSDIVMGGYFLDTGNVFIDTAELISHGGFDGFITRMDSIGRVKWIQTFGGTGYDNIGGIAIDRQNNIYITGGFQDTISIDSQLVINSGYDILIAKFNQNGNLIWTKQTNASGVNENGIKIISDESGNCYITGFFSGTAYFDSYTVSTSNSNDMFLTRYNSSGNCMGVQHFGTSAGYKMAVDNLGNVICGGYFSDTVIIGNTTLASHGGNDLYIAKSSAITGIKEERGVDRSINHLQIFSNPSTGKFKIKIPESIQDLTGATLGIFDASGKKISEQIFKSNHDLLYLDAVIENSGVYTVQLISKGKMFTGKAIVN